MKENKSYLERLDIKDWMWLEVDWEKCVVDIKKSGDIIKLFGETKSYIIDNIAKLLMLNSRFDNLNTQTEIECIKTRDKVLTLLKCDLVWEWKPYMIIDWKVWWSGWVYWSTDIHWNQTNTYYPSAEFITDDISNFVPINESFSRVWIRVYYRYYPIWNNQWIYPNPNEFQPIWDTKYWHDNNNLFCWSYCVDWADISDWIKIVSEEDELIVDSSNQVFYWSENVEVISPENFEHSLDNFYFDGSHVYLVYWRLYDITEMYKLEERNNIVCLGSDKYKIWEVEFTYKDWMLNKLD